MEIEQNNRNEHDLLPGDEENVARVESVAAPTVEAKAGDDCDTGRVSFWKRLLDIFTHYIVPLGLSVTLIIVFFREVNFREVKEIVDRGCNLWLIGAMMVIVVLSHMSRGIRWGIQLRGVGIKRMPPVAEWCAIFGAYALNIVFPRLGEAWRCLYISKRQKCPFMTVVGTDFGDRASDLLCVVVFIGMAFVLTNQAMHDFLSQYALGRIVADVFGHVWLWSGAAVVVIALWWLMHYRSQWCWVASMRRGLHNVWKGFAILFHMPQIGLYLWLTLAIWVCYFLETYICFFAFPFTEQMALSPGMAYGLKPGLLCLVFGVVSTIVPSNGGLGPWTIAVAYALEVFGLPKAEATAYALVVWGFEALTLVCLGIFTAIYITRSSDKRRQKAGGAA